MSDYHTLEDQFGREWTLMAANGLDDGGWLYSHDGLLAWPRKWITDPNVSLPSPTLADNPNYAGLCEICRSEWPK